MEDVTFIKSVDCRACAHEIEFVSVRSLKKISEHRSKCQKCRGCERLGKVKESLDKLNEAGK